MKTFKISKKDLRAKRALQARQALVIDPINDAIDWAMFRYGNSELEIEELIPILQYNDRRMKIVCKLYTLDENNGMSLEYVNALEARGYSG